MLWRTWETVDSLYVCTVIDKGSSVQFFGNISSAWNMKEQQEPLLVCSLQIRSLYFNTEDNVPQLEAAHYSGTALLHILSCIHQHLSSEDDPIKIGGFVVDYETPMVPATIIFPKCQISSASHLIWTCGRRAT